MPPHSPTEVVDDSDEELSEMRNDRGDEPHGGSGEMPAGMAVDATGGSPNRSKRAREPATKGGRTRTGRGTRHGDAEGGEDEGDDVPGRRPLSPGGDQPVTSREFRALLSQHFAEFSRSWQSMESRVAGVEHEAKTSRQERAILTSRVTQIERKEADLETKVHDLTKTVEDLKKEGVKHAPSGSAGGGGDPWAEYRARHGPVGARGDVGRGEGLQQPQGPPVGREELSEEDKRTLVVGRWLQDTKKHTILEEGNPLLQRPAIRGELDHTELQVWGPRRSFAVLKFDVRPGEQLQDVRERMWKVIREARANPVSLASTAAGGEVKNMWVAFSKTREARKRAAHGSLLRRVCVSMVRDASLNESHNPDAGVEGAYDVDWTSGTVWLNQHKIGSCSHRAPRGDSVKLLSSGWVDVMAAAQATGVTMDVALATFEREL